MGDTTTGLFDIEVVMVRRYKAVAAPTRADAASKAVAWAIGWAMRNREMDGKDFQVVGTVPAASKR